MIANKLQNDIISLYDRDFKAAYSINRIAILLKKAYPHINKRVNELITEGVLRQTVVGRSHLCSLNLRSHKAMVLLALQEICKTEKAVRQSKGLARAMQIIEGLNGEHNVLTAVANSHTLILVISDLSQGEQLLERLGTVPGYATEFYDRKSFQGLVLDRKGLLTEHVLIYGFERYFELLSEIDEKLPLSYE